MSQPTAAISISLAVNATNSEDSVQYTTTVANYATDVGPIASSLWAYLYNVTGTLATPSTTVSFIPGVVRINDVTAPRTPFGYYTTYVAGTPVATAQENQHFRWNFHLGPNDFSSQATLATALQAQIAQAVAFTPNY